MGSTARLLLTLAIAAGMLSGPGGRVVAQGLSADRPVGTSAQQVPAYLAKAGVEQRLGDLLPLDSPFTDDAGSTAALRSWFHGKPVVLALVYFRCAMLCPQVQHGLASGLHDTTLTPGKDYDVLVASIDPTDTPADAAAQKRIFLSEMGGGTAAASSVHFLTGPTTSIAALSAATGFHYVMVPGPDGKLDQFAHSSVIMFATPEGRLSKYLSGIDYPARDLRMALLEASAKRISNPVDLLILYCCSYNPVVGRYTVSILHVLGIAGMVTLAGIIGMLVLLTRGKPTGRSAA